MLFYNRIPRSGSASLVYVMKNAAQKDNKTNNLFTLVETTREIVNSYDVKDAQKKLHNIASLSRGNQKRVAVAGLTPFFPADLATVKDIGSVEFIQLFRNCANRLASNLMYSLFDSNEAKRAKKTGKWHQFMIKNLGVPNVTECIRDSSCLESSKLFSDLRVDNTRYYTTGAPKCDNTKNCFQGKEDYEFADARFSLARQNYIIFGFTEQFSKSLELFECVYPTFFRGNAYHILLWNA